MLNSLERESAKHHGLGGRREDWGGGDEGTGTERFKEKGGGEGGERPASRPFRVRFGELFCVRSLFLELA